MESLYKLLGVQRNVYTDADNRINLLVEKIISLLEEKFEMEFDKYENIQQAIREKSSANDDYSYFWDWMKDHGLGELKYILSNNLSDVDDIHVLLDYREMVLKLDLESENLDNLFTSIADTLQAIREYIDKYSQHSATVEQERDPAYKMETVNLPTYSDKDQSFNSSQWVISNNPAEIRQDFCYYVRKGGT